MKDEKVLAELVAIEKKNGILRPEDVVRFAENPKTALHDKFTWDNTEAAHQWRLMQARNLIRVTVNIEPNTGKEERIFVSLVPDRQNDGGGYRNLISVMSDKDMREQLLSDALAEMEVFRDKYKSLKELAAVFEEMRKVKVMAVTKKRSMIGVSAHA